MEEYDHNIKIGQPSTRTAMRRWRRTQVRGDFLPSPPRFGDRPGVPGGPSRFGGVLPQISSLIGLYLRDPCPNAHQDRVCPVFFLRFQAPFSTQNLDVAKNNLLLYDNFIQICRAPQKLYIMVRWNRLNFVTKGKLS